MVDVAHTGNNRDNEDEGDDSTSRRRDGDAESAEPDAEPAAKSDARSDGEPEAEPAAKPRRKRKPRSFWKELPILIGVALLLALLIQTFVARVFVIPSESMEATLHGCPGCYGDRVLVDKLVYDFGEPEPGEVVVFKRPNTWNQSEFRSNRSSNAISPGALRGRSIASVHPSSGKESGNAFAGPKSFRTAR